MKIRNSQRLSGVKMKIPFEFQKHTTKLVTYVDGAQENSILPDSVLYE